MATAISFDRSDAIRSSHLGLGDLMRQIANRKLWVGHAGDLRDLRAIMDMGLEAVVELADSEPFATLPRELVRCRFPISDCGENPAWLVRLAAEIVATFLRDQVPTLVCCAAGMSRSICVAAAGIALAEKLPLMEAVNLVTETGPVDVSAAFLAQVQQVTPP